MYAHMIVNPFVRLAQACRNEPLDKVYNLIAATARALNRGSAATQTGQLRWYVANMGIGLALVLAIAVAMS